MMIDKDNLRPLLWLYARCSLMFAIGALVATYAQTPLEEVAGKIETSAVGPIANALTGVAIVGGGLTAQFSEGAGWRHAGKWVFGSGIVMGALRIKQWLYM